MASNMLTINIYAYLKKTVVRFSSSGDICVNLPDFILQQ